MDLKDGNVRHSDTHNKWHNWALIFFVHTHAKWISCISCVPSLMWMTKAPVTLACEHLATNWRLKFQQPTCDKLGFICIKSLIGECLVSVGRMIASIYQFHFILRRIFSKYSHNILRLFGDFRRLFGDFSAIFRRFFGEYSAIFRRFFGDFSAIFRRFFGNFSPTFII